MFGLSIALAFLMSGCGSDDGSSSKPATIDSLPKGTGQVASSQGAMKLFANVIFDLASMIGFPIASNRSGVSTTGTKLSTATSLSWSGKSAYFCESIRVVRDTFREVSSPDKILCYLGAMDKKSIFTNVYGQSEQYQYYQFTGDMPFKVKFRIDKGDAGISLFQMYMCENDSQSEFVGTTIETDGTVSLTSVYSGGGGGWTGSAKATVTGHINSSGVWKDKVMTSQYTGASSGYSGSGSSTITQGSGDLTIEGFHSGSHDSNSFSAREYAKVATLNTGSLETFALGDGTAKVIQAYGAESHNDIKSWIGDTAANKSPASAGDHYSAANAGTPPAITTVSTSFGTGQTWNCAVESGKSFTVVPFATVTNQAQAELTECDKKFGDLSDDTNHLRCDTADW